jgi:photosystem II stability/assembly factor-like uncharacterized protein
MKSKLKIFSSVFVIAQLLMVFQAQAQNLTKLTSGTINDLYAVATPASNIAYVSGAAGTILKTINSGITWSAQTSTTTQPLRAIYFTTTTNGYAVGDNGAAIRTTNGGTTWTTMTTPAPATYSFTDVRFLTGANSSIGFITAGYTLGLSGGAIYKTTDGGTTWVTSYNLSDALGPFYSTFFTDANTGYAVRANGLVYKTMNGGVPVVVPGSPSSWAPGGNTSGIPPTVSQIYMTSATDGVFGSSNGIVYRTAGLATGSGILFTPTNTISTNTLRGLDFCDAANTTGYSVGGNIAANTGYILKTTTSGASWTVMTLPTGTVKLTGIDMFDCCNGFIAGNGGTILKVGTFVTVSATTALICNGTSTNLTATSTAAGTTTYSWSGPAGTLSSTTGATVTASPIVTTVYTVTATNNGCSAIAAVTVTVNPKPTITVANAEYCSGGSATLTALGAVTYTWTPATGLNKTTGNTVIANPTTTTIYTVKGTNANGCEGTTTVTVKVLGVPTIASFSPVVAQMGATVTIVGTNFNAIAANNIVYFGASRATVLTSTPSGTNTTTLTVKVPAGATYDFITVTNSCHLTAYSQQKFILTSPCSGTAAAPAPVNTSINNLPRYSVSGDFNIDGKPDIAVSYKNEFNPAARFSVLTNNSTSTTINLTKTDIGPALISDPMQIAVGDLDGDGLLDLVISDCGLYIYRNTSVGSTISFAAPISIPTYTRVGGVAINDINYDGKPDLVWVDFPAPSNSKALAVYENTTSAVGNITLSSGIAFPTGGNPVCVAFGDMNNDNKVDIIVTHRGWDYVTIYQNASATGAAISASTLSNWYFLQTPATACSSLLIGDLDGDSRLDIAVANYTNRTASFFRKSNTAGFTFDNRVDITMSNHLNKMNQLPTPSEFALSVHDLDGDQKPDLVVACIENDVEVFKNTSSFTSTSGTIAFGAPAVVYSSLGVRTASVVDLDGDGKAEIDVVDYNMPISKLPGMVTVKTSTTQGLMCKSLTEDFTAIDETTVSLAGQIFPNPTSGTVNIYPIAGNDLTTIIITDALGRTVLETKAIDNAAAVEVDLSAQPTGIYFVRLVNGANTLNKKIIKQ